MILDREFKRREEIRFLKDLIPAKNLSFERKEILISQLEDINKALIQEEKSFLSKIKNFLDITIFEF